MNIDTEVAGLKTMLEAHKLDTIKYLAGERCGVALVKMAAAANGHSGAEAEFKSEEEVVV